MFAFGDAPFLGSLPGLHVSVHDIKGIVPTSDNRGYFLVGQDGGVFAFGDAPFLGSLPGDGVHIDDVVGIAATPSDQGYWVVAGTGQVYAFGAAANLGSAIGTASPVSGIASTPDGGGYWIVTQNGGVSPVRRRGVLRIPPRRRDQAHKSGHRARAQRRRRGVLVDRLGRGGVHLRRCPVRRVTARTWNPHRRHRRSRADETVTRWPRWVAGSLFEPVGGDEDGPPHDDVRRARPPDAAIRSLRTPRARVAHPSPMV